MHVREVEMQLKAKEVEAAQAARFNLVSGTAAALAHEINQPMTAARALARSVQHLLRAPDIDFPRANNNLTNADRAGRPRRRRGSPHARILAPRPAAFQHHRRRRASVRCVRARRRGRTAKGIDWRSMLPTTCRPSTATQCSFRRSCSISFATPPRRSTAHGCVTGAFALSRGAAASPHGSKSP